MKGHSLGHLRGGSDPASREGRASSRTQPPQGGGTVPLEHPAQGRRAASSAAGDPNDECADTGRRSRASRYRCRDVADELYVRAG